MQLPFLTGVKYVDAQHENSKTMVKSKVTIVVLTVMVVVVVVLVTFVEVATTAAAVLEVEFIC